MQMQMSALGSWAACPNAAATNILSLELRSHTAGKSGQNLPTYDPYPGLRIQVDTWCVAVQQLISHFLLTFPPLKNVKPHNSAPEEAGRTRQDLMTLQRKLANNGDWASLWEESEMLLLSLGHGFIAQHAKLPMLCQKQTHIAQQELSWLTLLIPLLLW